MPYPASPCILQEEVTACPGSTQAGFDQQAGTRENPPRPTKPAAPKPRPQQPTAPPAAPEQNVSNSMKEGLLRWMQEQKAAK